MLSTSRLYIGSTKFFKKITREKYNGINVKINVDFRKNGWVINCSKLNKIQLKNDCLNLLFF